MKEIAHGDSISSKRLYEGQGFPSDKETRSRDTRWSEMEARNVTGEEGSCRSRVCHGQLEAQSIHAPGVGGGIY